MRRFLFILLLLWSFPVWASVQFDSDDNGVIDAQYLLLIQADCSGETETGIFCLDSGDGKLYYYDGDSVEEVGTGSGGDVVDDTTPQLGGNLDMAGYGINDDTGDSIVNFLDPILLPDLTQIILGSYSDWGIQNDSSDSDALLISTTNASDRYVKITNAGAGDAILSPDALAINASATPGVTYLDSDVSGTTSQQTIAQSVGGAETTTPGSEDGSWTLSVKDGGSMTEAMKADGANLIIYTSIPFYSLDKVETQGSGTTLAAEDIMGQDHEFTAAVTLVLPAVSGVSDGANACFINRSGGAAVLDPNVSDNIRLKIAGSAESTLSDGVAVTSDGDGEVICIRERGAAGWDAWTVDWASE